MLSSKERLLKAIKHEEGDYVPVAPRISMFAHMYYPEESGNKDLKLAKEFDFDPTFVVRCVENYIAKIPGEGQYNLENVDVEIDRKDDGNTYVITRRFKTPAGILLEKIRQVKPSCLEYGIAPNPVKMEYLIKSKDDLDKVPYLFTSLRNRNLDSHHQLEKEVGGNGLVEVAIPCMLDYRLGEAFGMENLMVCYYEDRTFFDRMINLFHQRVMEETKFALEQGAKAIFGVWFYCSLSAGWSPQIFKECFLPLIKEHVDLVHSYNSIYEYYDDGKCMGILDCLAEAKIDILGTLTPPPVGDFDLKKAKQKIGDKICLHGYTDLLYVLKLGTPQLVEQSVKEAIEIAAPGGGFILGTSDNIREGTPLENIKTYFKAARKYGKYPIKI